MSAITGIYEARDPFEELRQFLKSERLAKHALYIATPSLVEETSQWLTSGLCNNGRALSKLAAYAARMAYRTTPFGICAAVGLVETGHTTNLAVDTGRWRTRVRPDMGHLLGACTTLPRNERSKIKYVANGAVYRRGGRLYVTHIPHSFVTASEKGNAITEQLPVSIKLTAAVTSIVADASEPIEYSILAGKLANRYNSELKAAEEYLDTLIEAGVLISELHLSPVGDPISRLASRLIEISNPIGKKLCKGLQITNEINALPLRDRAESAYRDVVTAFSGIGTPNTSHAVQVDAVAEFDGQLSSHVIADVERLAEYMMRQSPVLSLRALHSRFLERYEGTDRMVPLLELMDPQLGIGMLSSLEAEAKPTVARNRLLLEMACESQRSLQQEVGLNERQLDVLFPPIISESELPQSIEFGFHVCAKHTEDINEGNYTVLPAGIASNRAARSIGRFYHLFSKAEKQHIRKAVARAFGPKISAAELVFAPANARSYNVSIRGRMVHAAIPIGIGARRSTADFEPADLYVGLNNGRFFLWSASKQQAVAPTESHMYATQRGMPDICRFLSGVAGDMLRAPQGFDWGPAATLTYLPRLRSGRLIFAPRRWIINVDRDERSGGLTAAVRRYREDWGMPRHVLLCQHDNRLLLDLDSPIASTMLANFSGVAERLEVIEALPGPSDIWLQGLTGKHSVEFVISLFRPYSSKAQPVPAVPSWAIVKDRKLHGLSSSWAFLKLYAPNQSFDNIMTQLIAPLVVDFESTRIISRWFFLRYSDPNPHLRIRFKSESLERANVVRQRLAAASEEWLQLGLVGRSCFDTYDPEYERYGGPDDLPAMEAHFHASSKLCLRLIGSTSAAVASKIAVAAESFLTFLSDRTLCKLALASFQRKARSKLHPNDRLALKSLQNCNASASDDSLLFLSRAEAGDSGRLAAAYHLHCNRMGIPSASEYRAVTLMRATLVSRAARARS